MDTATVRASMAAEQLVPRGIDDERVLDAMRSVPRHRFVPDVTLERAYADHPLRIGEGQTISQPYVVALTAQLLALHPTDRVLEVGTGTGYAAAVLDLLAADVTTVERHASLAAGARAVLRELGYGVRVVEGDGSLGWPDGAPFDAIAVAAAGPTVPAALCEQLADGGRLVLPVGGPRVQRLVRVVRSGAELRREDHGAVRFVPLVVDR